MMKRLNFKNGILDLFPKAKENNPLWGYYLEDLEDGTLRLRYGQSGTLALYDKKKKRLKIVHKEWLNAPESSKVLKRIKKVLE